MKPINYYFPIEVVARELDYRLVLAVKAVEKQHRIFVGQAAHLLNLIVQTEGGVFLGKHIMFSVPQRKLALRQPTNPLAYRIAKDHGAAVIHHSEEGAVFVGDENSWRATLDNEFDPRLFDAEDPVLTWGAFQAEHYKSKQPACTDRVVATGHPRFDLLAPKYRPMFEDDANAYRKQYGDFVLINTNFGLALHPQGWDYVFSEFCHYDARDVVIRERFISQWRGWCNRVPAFVELVHKLSIRRPDVNFVVRPHPSDDDTLFRAAFRGVPNIHVVRKGGVVPWLLACRMVIHDGCTTGIEGYLLDRPVLNYRPVNDPSVDLYLPNVLGLTATQTDEAVRIVMDVLSRPDEHERTPHLEDIPERAHSVFRAFRHEAFPEVIEWLREGEGRARASRKEPARGQMIAEQVVGRAFERAKGLVRPLSRDRWLSAKHAKAVFPGLDKAVIAERLRVIQKLVGKRVEWSYHGPALIEIRAA